MKESRGAERAAKGQRELRQPCNPISCTSALTSTLHLAISALSLPCPALPCPHPPLMARARESMVSISRWFVGSSSSSMCGVRCASQANTTRLLRPSDRFLMGSVCVWPVMPKRPITDRIFSSPSSRPNSLSCGVGEKWGRGGRARG